VKDGRARLKLGEVDTARAFVFTKQGNQ